MIEKRNFIQEINIDRFNLEKECAENGEKVIYWGEKWADTEAQKERTKKELDEVRGELDIRIRKNPGNYGIEKITEGVINSLIPLQEKYIEANEKYIEARETAMTLSLVKEAFLQRKDLLLAEVRLFLGGYYTSEDKINLGDEKSFQDRIRMKRKLKSDG